jgi:hypothetical protein
MGVTVPDPSDPRDYRHIVHMQDDGEEPQRPPLSWRDWCEIAVLAVFVSGCSAGLTLGLDRALYGDRLMCVGAIVRDGALQLPPLPRLPH